MTGRYTVSDALAKEWNAAKEQYSSDGQTMAGLFRGFIPDGYGLMGQRVLYVGQATAGRFDEPDVHATAFDGSHGFWDFARRFSKVLSPELTPHDCVAWTNISKLALTDVKPCESLLDHLKDLAIRTLIQEIATTRPNVIVFVSHHFGEEVLTGVVDQVNPSPWIKSEDDGRKDNPEDIWWRKPHLGAPAALWMRHPRGNSHRSLDFAAHCIAKLHDAK